MIARDKLLNRVKDTQAFLKVELERVSRQTDYFGNIRGYGTFIGFDVKPEKIHKLQKFLHQGGVYANITGTHSIGLTPALILEPKHAAPLRDVMKMF